MALKSVTLCRTQLLREVQALSPMEGTKGTVGPAANEVGVSQEHDAVDKALQLWFQSSDEENVAVTRTQGRLSPWLPDLAAAAASAGGLLASEASFIAATQTQLRDLCSQLSKEKQLVDQLKRELQKEKRAHARKANALTKFQSRAD